MDGSKARLLLLSTGTGLGGTEKVLTRLALAERSRWESVGVCSLKPPGIQGRVLAQEGVPVFTCNLGERRGLLGFAATLAALPRLLRIVGEFRPTVVHAFLFRAALLARLPAMLGRMPRLVVSIRRLERRSQLAHLCDRMTCESVHAFTSVSHAAAWEIARRSGIPRERIECIPNGIEVPGPPANSSSVVAWRDQRRRQARQRLEGLLGPLPKTLIGSAGRLEPVKGHRVLLQAAARVLPHSTNGRTAQAAGIVLAGDGSERLALESMARETALTTHVHFLGERTDLEDLLPAFDLFVLPSRSEGLSNALLEAMAEGIPAVASRAGGNAEVIEHGVSGLLFEVDNPASLAGHLAKLLRNPEGAMRLGLQGRQRVRKDFSLEKMLQSYRTLYERILLPL
ncbi:MAG: glycosyltransferase [Acidobacteriota bacterium]